MFSFTLPERQVIEERRRLEPKLRLALQIGFSRMSGRVLDAVRVVRSVLWRHLGEQLEVAYTLAQRPENRQQSKNAFWGPGRCHGYRGYCRP